MAASPDIHPFPKSAPGAGAVGVGGPGLMWWLKENGYTIPPELIAIVGVVSALCLLAAAFQFLKWVGQSIGDQRENPQSILSKCIERARVRLVPMLLLTIGLVGALLLSVAVIGYFASSPRQADAAVKADASTKPQEPRFAADPPERKSILAASRFYSRADREQVADALSAIEAAYKHPGMDAARHAQEITQNVGGVPWDQLDVLIVKMVDLKSKTQKIEDDMKQARERYLSFHSEIDFLTRSRHRLSQFIRGIDQYTKVMRAYRKFAPEARDGDGTNLGDVLMGAREDFYRSRNDFQQWMQELDRSIEATRTELKQ
ncbi:MAG: hypothetical protein K2Y27_02045 [Xanthobacteraceae bacterium]|nr:hypothetical protein [Xanthobacteraceae bacterium]